MSAPIHKTEAHHRALEAQLVIGLKFHYPDTLKNIPLDVALRAMAKVWESCQEKESNNSRPDNNMGAQDDVIYL